MSIELDIQNVSKMRNVPKEDLFKNWILATLKDQCIESEITLRVVDSLEMIQLNFRYRGKKQPTNVLAFSLEAHPLIGDVVICAPVVMAEAHSQKKEPIAHWAHLTIHGILHLLGYDHIEPLDATRMEEMEIKILNNLGFSNPYE